MTDSNIDYLTKVLTATELKEFKRTGKLPAKFSELVALIKDGKLEASKPEPKDLVLTEDDFLQEITDILQGQIEQVELEEAMYDLLVYYGDYTVVNGKTAPQEERDYWEERYSDYNDPFLKYDPVITIKWVPRES